MINMLLSTFSVIAFCVCCRFLILSIRQPVPFYKTTEFSKTALRVKKAYKVFAWGMMTSVFLLSLVVSFVQVYTTL